MKKIILHLVACLLPIVAAAQNKVPVIDVTDLYHMHQDPGDNIDLINAYALSEIDLKAVILDCSEGFRGIKAGLGGDYTDPAGPRDAGFVPVLQLNYIFDRNVPFGVAPFAQMGTPDDKMTDVPKFQQSGIDLILKVLAESEQKVVIVSFGSARPIAVAYNRNPELFMKKVAKIHLSGGGGYPDHPEWNVGLDPKAFICLLRSHMPIDLYPCASMGKGPTPANYFSTAFTVDTFNTYWKLKSKNCIYDMRPPLKRYIAFALGRNTRNDFLRAMDVDDSTETILERFYDREHHVWETAIWCQVANRSLVKTALGWRIVSASAVNRKYERVAEEMLPCKVSVASNGYYVCTLTNEPTNFRIYKRENPLLYEEAMNSAFPEYFKSILIR